MNPAFFLTFLLLSAHHHKSANQLTAQLNKEVKESEGYPLIVFSTAIDEESADAVINVLEQLNKTEAKAVIIELNTPGGNVDDGFRISKAIEGSALPVICVVDGEASSMGFYILQSCDVRLMTKRSTLLAHFSDFPSYKGRLDIRTLKFLLSHLETSNKATHEHNCHRIKLPFEECYKKISEEWSMAWKEAVTVNAVDGAVNSVAEVLYSYIKGTPLRIIKP